ncbi:hypothetical protein CDN99_19990 [Roseateles aquatilis]|uniref:Peptidase n=1 Tax=Roseateles aquatilis TaxID=431061 RepID=A0A246J305_9BURK|nr:SapC family protein [Roseateles aquatilis]OWQ86981.1 hypothetical protein CDN99_19990 [Roseateles aquatilis]
MTTVLLNSAEHQHLRIVTRRGSAYGDAVMSSPLFPAEFRNAQAHYPIVFREDAGNGGNAGDGAGLHPVALFGLTEGSNLFLDHRGADTVWDAHYLPWAIERQPFMIGRGEGPDDLLVHVDLLHPRVRLAADDDTPVFGPLGGASETLERASSLLRAIHEGMQTLPAFIDALLTHELLESFVLDIESEHGGVTRIAGFHAINEERLAALDATALAALHRAGHLQPIYMAVASMSQLRPLIERHRRLGP